MKKEYQPRSWENKPKAKQSTKHNWGKQSHSNKEFYNSRAWRKNRAEYIYQNPFDEWELKKGRKVIGEIVDHIIPITQGGDKFAFSNLQTLTKKNHNIKTQQDKIKYKNGTKLF